MVAELSRPDGEINQDVTDAINADARIEGARIDAESIGGVVYLRGTAPNLSQKKVARDISSRIRGVREVVDDITVLPEVPRTDEDIASDVRAALSRDVWVDQASINVAVHSGQVQLTGWASSYAAKTAATEDAWSIRGVIDVQSHVILIPLPTRSDDQIAAELQHDLTRNIRVEESAVRIECSGGIVHLHGQVDTDTQRWLANELAWWTAGVTDVVNDLSVVQHNAVQ